MQITSLLRNRLIQLGINIPKNTNKEALQIQFAPVLRKMAIDHLRHGDGVVARGFRGESSAIKMGADDFLNSQERNGEWGTYIEATALAEILGCHLVVTTKTGTFGLYRAEDDNAPVVQLTNFSNTHWAHKDEHTLGNGNCLYNAFALALQDLTTEAEVKDKTQQKSAEASSLSTSRGTLFNSSSPTNIEVRAIAEQQERLEMFNRTISKFDKPSEVDKKARAEEERMAKLSPEKRKQIESDHAMALDMTLNPSKYNNNY